MFIYVVNQYFYLIVIISLAKFVHIEIQKLYFSLSSKFTFVELSVIVWGQFKFSIWTFFEKRYYFYFLIVFYHFFNVLFERSMSKLWIASYFNIFIITFLNPKDWNATSDLYMAKYCISDSYYLLCFDKISNFAFIINTSYIIPSTCPTSLSAWYK